MLIQDKAKLESVREKDNNGYMHVATSNLTKEQVVPYMGDTIPGYKDGNYIEYALVWNEYALYYYVNGVLAKVNDKIAPVDDVFPAYILYTCYIGPKGSGAFWGEVDDKNLPQAMKVDWLRVYK